jgi:glycosyltransferase involved in cell wall biosynthesis
MPLATIIVPAHNAERSLSRTLRALLAQSFEDFEVVIVNDGSFDWTEDLALAFTEDPRVRLVNQPNQGPAGARNTGIAAARGSYIGFCDAGDIWARGTLAAHLEQFAANPDLGLSLAPVHAVDATGRATGARAPAAAGRIGATAIFTRGAAAATSAAMVRRAALDSLAWRPAGETARDWIFDETLRRGSAGEAWLRLALGGRWQVAGLPRRRGRAASVGRPEAALETDPGIDPALLARRLAPLAPEFFCRHLPVARAWHLARAGRAALKAGDVRAAAWLARQSLAVSRAPLWRQPLAFLALLGGAHALSILGHLVAGQNDVNTCTKNAD